MSLWNHCQREKIEMSQRFSLRAGVENWLQAFPWYTLFPIFRSLLKIKPMLMSSTCFYLGTDSLFAAFMLLLSGLGVGAETHWDVTGFDVGHVLQSFLSRTCVNLLCSLEGVAPDRMSHLASGRVWHSNWSFCKEKQATSHKVLSVSEPTQNGELLGLSILLVQPLHADAKWVFSKSILNITFSTCST